MKKFYLAMILGVMCSLVISAAALGATHPYSGDTAFRTFFGGNSVNDWVSVDYAKEWFSVTPSTPKLQMGFVSRKDYYNLYGAEYVVNDQTFVGINYRCSTGAALAWPYTFAAQSSNDAITNFRGSYLFNFGLFTGVDYYSFNGSYRAIVSPGYRFNLGEANYVALSMDYLLSDTASDNNQVVDYELSGVYYPENAKLYGEVVVPNTNFLTTAKTSYLAGINFRIMENIVFGASYENNSNGNTFSGGLTIAAQKLTVNGKFMSVNETAVYTEYQLGCYYRFAESFGAGIGYDKFSNSDEGSFTGQIGFYFGNASLQLGYIPENDNANQDQMMTALFKMNF